LLATPPPSLFLKARDAPAALSGLLLLLGCWEKSHDIAQGVDSREGSYWHAIIHRMEPDSGNSSYWFRRVGEHPIFPQLYDAAAGVLAKTAPPGWTLTNRWDPYLFIEWCDEARTAKGSNKELAAVEIQRAEWELLFAWCAGNYS